MVYAALALLLSCFVAAVAVAYHLIRFEMRENQQVLLAVVRHETERLQRKVDQFVEVSAGAKLWAQHAVVSSERAEKAAERSAEHAEMVGAPAQVVVVVSPVDPEPGDGRGVDLKN